MKAATPRTPTGMRIRREAAARQHNADAIAAMQTERRQWYAVHVGPGREFIVQAEYCAEGVPTFLPVRIEYRRQNRYQANKKPVVFSLLPRLLFVGLPPGSERWDRILAPNRATSAIGIGGRPTALRAGVLQEWLSRIGTGVEPPPSWQHMRSGQEFHEGDKARVVAGPFEGHIIDVESIRGPRAIALANLLGAEQRVQVRLDNLERV